MEQAGECLHIVSHKKVQEFILSPCLAHLIFLIVCLALEAPVGGSFHWSVVISVRFSSTSHAFVQHTWTAILISFFLYELLMDDVTGSYEVFKPGSGRFLNHFCLNEWSETWNTNPLTTGKTVWYKENQKIQASQAPLVCTYQGSSGWNKWLDKNNWTLGLLQATILFFHWVDCIWGDCTSCR